MPVLVYPNSSKNASSPGSGDEVVYSIVLPEAGQWYLWGRFYYHGAEGESSAANSFFVGIDGKQAEQFGNNKVFQKWHWDGAGRKTDDTVSPTALGYLTAGFHELKVEKRETQAEPPRLDALFLTRNPDEVPTDAEASAALCPNGDCSGFVGSECGDATGDGRITAADAWVVLASAVKLGSFCTQPICDVDADGTVTASDAMRVLEHAIHPDGGVVLTCSASLQFFVEGATGLTDVTLQLDYSALPIAFVDSGDAPACVAGQQDRVADVSVDDDTRAGSLELRVRLAGPVTGTVNVATCRYRVTEGGSAFPAAGTTRVRLAGHVAAGGTPRASTAVSFK
jgi:hypothetical protein